jgi:hypothetical protein
VLLRPEFEQLNFKAVIAVWREEIGGDVVVRQCFSEWGSTYRFCSGIE